MSIPAEIGVDENDHDTMARLKICWDRYSPAYIEELRTRLRCLRSGEGVALNGIERDLLVYALAFTRNARG